jgi:hypothetical protein
MIVILKRDDLREPHRQWPIENLLLDHADLAPEIVNQAELIVFVEGTEVNFLKHLPDIKSQNSFNILLSYIKSESPTKHRPFSVKDFSKHRRHPKKKE